MRFGLERHPAVWRRSIYYGTVDATPLFVMLLGELRRWGCPRDEIARSLLPAADRALEWIENYGDRDGDGFVEYQRPTDHGLLNQGWKDSWDGINFADGTIAEPPIALCEVQGYVYSAYLARAPDRLGRRRPDRAAERWTAARRELKEAFNETFWLPDRGYFAIALDRDKTPGRRAAPPTWATACGPASSTRTRPRRSPSTCCRRRCSAAGASARWRRDMGAYNPISYHNGSVWPHDNALIAAGLHALRLRRAGPADRHGLLDAADALRRPAAGAVLRVRPEPVPDPVPYPTSCSPQAWAPRPRFLPCPLARPARSLRTQRRSVDEHRPSQRNSARSRSRTSRWPVLACRSTIPATRCESRGCPTISLCMPRRGRSRRISSSHCSHRSHDANRNGGSALIQVSPSGVRRNRSGDRRLGARAVPAWTRGDPRCGSGQRLPGGDISGVAGGFGGRDRGHAAGTEACCSVLCPIAGSGC